jgi:hypothetical protein
MRVHFYHPTDDPWDVNEAATPARRFHVQCAMLLDRWGHKVESFVRLPPVLGAIGYPVRGPDGLLYRPLADANPAVPDVWIIFTADGTDPLPAVENVSQVRCLTEPGACPADLSDLGRKAAIWNATFHAEVGGTVVSEWAHRPYRHPNHFAYTHPWEAESRRRWLADLCPGSVFLDVGASVGSWALRRLLAENGFGGRVEVVPRLVADAAGRQVARADVPWHSVPPEGEFPDFVPVTSVDAFVAERGLGRVDLVKVDTDGGEREVLAGMAGTLKRFRPPVVVETHTFLGVTVADVSGRLDALGYEVAAFPMEDGYYWHVYGTPRG